MVSSLRRLLSFPPFLAPVLARLRSIGLAVDRPPAL